MDYAYGNEIKKEIKKYAYSLGINKIGFADAKPLENHLSRLLRRQNGNYSYSINEGDPARRIDLSMGFPEARSVICAAVAYNGQDYIPPDDDSLKSGARGRLSFISRGRDYHAIMCERLEKLKLYIMKVISGANISIMVDKEEILEKAFAVEAGLGWFGKNTLLVTPEFGSFVYLGELVTDISFPPDSPINEGCGACSKCLEACPTRALDQKKNLNPDRCLAGISQYKGIIEPEIRGLMRNTIYGCDICQMVCPYNSRVVIDRNTDVHDSRESGFAGYDQAFPLLSELLQMSNAEFKKRFGYTAGAWRGRTVFQRNAIIAAGNARDDNFVPELIRILQKDSRPVMRGTAAWALGRIGSPEAYSALKEALSWEQDQSVIDEIKNTYK